MLTIVLALARGQAALRLGGVEPFDVAKLKDAVRPPRPGALVDLRARPERFDAGDQSLAQGHAALGACTPVSGGREAVGEGVVAEGGGVVQVRERVLHQPGDLHLLRLRHNHRPPFGTVWDDLGTLWEFCGKIRLFATIAEEVEWGAGRPNHTKRRNRYDDEAN